MADYDYIKTKGTLGAPDNAGAILKRPVNRIKINNTPGIIEQETIGNGWIVGSARNGIVGVNTNTIGGGQQIVGGSGRVNTLMRVVNRNNVHYERFLDENLKDATSTGSWDILTHGSVIFDGQFVLNKAFFADVTNITNATISVSGVTLANALFYLSSDGTNFELVSNNVQHGFTHVGQVGKWKIVAFGGYVVVTEVIVKYNQ